MRAKGNVSSMKRIRENQTAGAIDHE